nr:HAMP domain-containing sensor histidine kinase [Altererythrobacter sp. KTW20L]
MIPPTPPASDVADAGLPQALPLAGRDGIAPPAKAEAEAAVALPVQHTGSISRRMILIAAGWIFILLAVGGVALNSALTNLVSSQFDRELEESLTAMIASTEIDPLGEVYYNRILGDQRFLEPNSGFYWQISGGGFQPYLSRSLWDSPLEIRDDVIATDPIYYDSEQFEDERLRIAQRTVGLPGSDVQWQYVVAGSREELDLQLADIRAILIWSFAVLGIGLFIMAMLQTWYGLGPLRRIRRAIARIRTSGANRVTDPLPLEVQPMVEELNALLAHSERQAEEARTHAGNLAHALKTPLTVLTNAAAARSPDLGETVLRETLVMRRQVDHHLARARAAGRRAVGLARTNVMDSAKAVERAVSRLYPDVRFDIDGSVEAGAVIEKQDLEEILGNLIENAAKYGGGSVFVTVDAEPDAEQCTVWIEDDGVGIPPDKRGELFTRGARLDTEKPGTGLGLAIVRDVAEIYRGSVELGESEDLGGLLVRLRLPRWSG